MASDIRFESFGPATAGSTGNPSEEAPQAGSQTFNVVFARSGKSAKWTPGAGSLLELAEDNGVKTRFACRQGICGTCVARIRSGSVGYNRKLDKNPDAKHPFIVRKGMLVSLGNPGGHLITDAVYDNFRLEVEYRFAAKPGNCGVLVHASTPRALYKMFPKSIEVQMYSGNAGDFWCIVEDITVPNMEKRRGKKANWGITEGKARRILNLTNGSEKPVGKWNAMTIECVDNAIKVWVNKELVNHGYNCTAKKGQIAIQVEGSEVEFRKFLLTPIKKLTP